MVNGDILTSCVLGADELVIQSCSTFNELFNGDNTKTFSSHFAKPYTRLVSEVIANMCSTDEQLFKRIELPQIDSHPHFELSFNSLNGNCYCAVRTVKSNSDLIDKNTALFKELVHTSPDGIYRTDIEGNFTFVNDAICSFYGFQREDLIGKNFTDFVAEKDRSIIAEFYINQFLSKTELTYKEVLIVNPKTKKQYWIGQRVQLVKEGEWVLGFQVVARDITDRKLMELELIEKQKEHQALLEAIPHTVMRLNSEGIILDFHLGEDSFFPEDTNLISQHLSDHLNEKTATDLIERGKKTLSDDHLHYYTFDLFLDDQVHHYYEAALTRFSKTEYIISIEDITRHRLAQNELKAKSDEALDKQKSNEEFVSILSHEIRNPLNVIKGLADQLNKTIPEQKKDYVDGIIYSSENVLGLVNNILDLSKLDANKITLEETNFDLRHLVKRVLKTTELSNQKSNVKTSFLFDGNLPELVVGDSLRVQQILTNLVNNSFKFTEEGFIRIEIGVLSKTDSEINLGFEVSDSGIGIPTDKISTIFDAYEQASLDTSRKYGGTGLGLSIVKKLIEIQGGSIEVRSRLQQGSSFIFNIKLKLSSEEDNDDQLSKKVRILLAEDNRLNQVVITNYLQSDGISMDMAVSGAVAAQKIRTNFYDLILLDLHLSDINGYELIEMVSDEKLPPIICISGDTLELNELKEKGFNDYIKKPIDRSILEQKVSHYTGISFSTSSDNTVEGSEKYKLIDLSYLIDSSLNDQKYIVNMINIFLEKAPNYLSDMQKSYAENDLVELKRIAHKFKASLNIMGIKSATKLINVLEVNIQKDQNLGDLNKLLTGIELYTISACKELENYLDK